MNKLLASTQSEDEGIASTIAFKVEQSDLVVLATVTGSSAGDDGAAPIVGLSVQKTLKGSEDLSCKAFQHPDASRTFDTGNSGLFFLVSVSRFEDPAFNRVGIDGRPSWVLGSFGDFIPLATPQFDQIVDYVGRLASVRGAFITIAMGALVSDNSLLRSEAAFDLERYDFVESFLPESGTDTLLNTLCDPNFPDEARAAPARVISKLRDGKPRLNEALLLLLDSGIGNTGFQIEAAQILSAAPSPDSKKAFLRLLKSDNHILWAQALTGLGVVGDSEALDALRVAASEHPDPGTRDVARQILDQLDEASPTGVPVATLQAVPPDRRASRPTTEKLLI